MKMLSRTIPEKERSHMVSIKEIIEMFVPPSIVCFVFALLPLFVRDTFLIRLFFVFITSIIPHELILLTVVSHQCIQPPWLALTVLIHHSGFLSKECCFWCAHNLLRQEIKMYKHISRVLSS